MGMTTSITPYSGTDAISIRPLKGLEDCLNFQKAVQMIWGGGDDDAIPIHVLVTLAKNGGLVMAAYAPDGPEVTGGIVGIVLGWLGLGADPATPDAPPKIKFCSHMAGVLPAWQGKHIGLRLKLAQRDYILEQGLTDWVTWTFDPLYRANGVFNIHRLGATCTTYMRNIYGELNDDLNRGVPSDRCQVDWRLNSPRVAQKAQDQGNSAVHAQWEPEILEILPSSTNAAGFATPGDPAFVGEGRPLAVPIPSDIAAIRRTDRELSLAWRFYLRAVLEEAFGAGYTMVDCIHLPNRGWHYILVRDYM
jgi:predicted GNAT superfamily acetyltransferase